MKQTHDWLGSLHSDIDVLAEYVSMKGMQVLINSTLCDKAGLIARP